MRLRITGLVFFICMFSSVVAAENNYLELSLEQLMQVKVTGSTLRDESIKTVPAAVTVFTREQIARLGLDYLYELINLVPGFQFNRNGDSPAGYTFSARGRRNSAEAHEVLLLVDGRVFSDPRTGSADGSLPLFPVHQIERVEVIRGPGSALYGSSAFNGVINVITRTHSNSFSLNAGSQSQRRAQFNFSQQQQQQKQQQHEWDINVFAQVYEDKGDEYFINNVLTSDPRKTADLDLSVSYSATKIRAAYHKATTENFYVGETISDEINYYQQVFKQLSIEHELIATEPLKTKVNISYVNTFQHLNLMLLPAGYLMALSQPASDAPFIAKAILAGETYQVALTNDWAISPVASAQFGVDWHLNRETKAQAKNNFDLMQLAQGNFPIPYYGDFSQSTPIGYQESQKALGVYAQYLRALSTTTNLTLGMRYDDYKNVGAHLSPRLGVVQQLTDQQTLKVLYGEAFRAPSLSEMGLMNNPILVGNPRLEYEIVKTWDVIWLGNWHNTSISVGGFRNEYESPIAVGWIGAARTYVNGADEHSEGMELEASQQFNEQWLVRVTYTHLFELPQSAFREAEHLTSLTLNYDADKWNWNLSGVYHRTRNALVVSGVHQPLEAYWVVDTKLMYRLTKAYEINVKIKNMFDAEFFTPTQGAGIPEGIPSRGREWGVGLEWKY